MATSKIDLKGYCNTLYIQLSGMKTKLDMLIGEIEGFQGKDIEHVRSHADHLRDLIKTIDWKLEIFTKVCPLDSGGYAKDAVEGASITTGKPEDFSGGYVGG